MFRRRREDYTVGWVCALPIELAAAQGILDEKHENVEQAPQNDPNVYSLGSIAGHNVAIVCLPAGRIGNNPATAVATWMQASFPGLRLGLMVGIGGGVPSKTADIRLGDVVVSQPSGAFGGVVQYDSGKSTPSGFERTGSLNTPPGLLLGALNNVKANHSIGQRKFPEYLTSLTERQPMFRREKAGPDSLYKTTSLFSSLRVSADQERPRTPRDNDVVVHYGTIASGNQVIKNARMRDKISRDLGGVLCFEMEAAGLMNDFPCLVVRGICDYADSHKNKTWQPFAAATAAAFAKEVLLAVPPSTPIASIASIASIHPKQTVYNSPKTPTPIHKSLATSSIYSIPFPRNRSFVGREIALDELTQKLITKKTCQKMTISGLGGTGKTQVALKFAYNVKDNYPDYSVFWVPALSMASFNQACADILRLLPIPQTLDADKEAKKAANKDPKEVVKEYLSSPQSGKWLLVVDNVDDYAIAFGDESSKGIKSYLPQSDDGVILFTTRTLHVAASLTRQHILKLGSMSPEEAVDFLETSLTETKLLREDQSTVDLLEQLAYLPLAIAQAAAYLNMNETSVSQYLRLLRDTTEQDIVRLMSEEFHDETRYENTDNAVATTWVVSFLQIQERNAAAANLLAFIGCIEWKAIPRSILPKESLESDTETALGLLRSYSFIKQGKDENMYDMHRLVHIATGLWTRRQDSIQARAQAAMEHVAAVFPPDEWEFRKVWREFLPHAIRLLSENPNVHADQRAVLCSKVGGCLRRDGRIEDSIQWFEQCYQLRKELDETNPLRLISEHNLGYVYTSNDQAKEAVPLLEHVVAVRERLLEEENLSLLASQHELARAYTLDRQVKKGLELLERIVAVQDKTLPETHIAQLDSQHALADAYHQDAQTEKAIKVLEHVVSVQTRVMPEEHPDQLLSQYELAIMYQAIGQIKEAIELLEHVVSIEESSLTKDDPKQMISQFWLGVVYTSDNQLDKAKKLLNHVLAVRKNTLGAEHPHTIRVEFALSVAYYADQEYETALTLMEHVAAVRRKILGDDHADVLAAEHELGRRYLKVGNTKKGIEVFEHVVNQRNLSLLPTDLNRIRAEDFLAYAYFKDGQMQKGLELLEQVVEIKKQIYEADHPKLISAQAELEKWRKI